VREMVLRPTGLLRIGASLSFCLEHISPLLPAFMARYPALNVELVASNRYYDLIENGIDVAIRTRRIENDSSITIRRLAETRRLLAASPDYLACHGIPDHPDALARHRMLIYTLADTPETGALLFDAAHSVERCAEPRQALTLYHLAEARLLQDQDPGPDASPGILPRTRKALRRCRRQLPATEPDYLKPWWRFW